MLLALGRTFVPTIVTVIRILSGATKDILPSSVQEHVYTSACNISSRHTIVTISLLSCCIHVWAFGSWGQPEAAIHVIPNVNILVPLERQMMGITLGREYGHDGSVVGYTDTALFASKARWAWVEGQWVGAEGASLVLNRKLGVRLSLKIKVHSQGLIMPKIRNTRIKTRKTEYLINVFDWCYLSNMTIADVTDVIVTHDKQAWYLIASDGLFSVLLTLVNSGPVHWFGMKNAMRTISQVGKVLSLAYPRTICVNTTEPSTSCQHVTYTSRCLPPLGLTVNDAMTSFGLN